MRAWFRDRTHPSVHRIVTRGCGRLRPHLAHAHRDDLETTVCPGVEPAPAGVRAAAAALDATRRGRISVVARPDLARSA